jgi:hypothetical protein
MRIGSAAVSAESRQLGAISLWAATMGLALVVVFPCDRKIPVELNT